MARLYASHGTATAAAVIAAGQRNAALLAEVASAAGNLAMRNGVVRLAPVAAADELSASVTWLAASGAPVRLGAPRDLLPSAPDRFVLAALHADDANLDVAALHAALQARAVAAGVRSFTSARVESLAENGRVHVLTERGLLHAEIAIVATGAELPRLVPFCRFKVIGMRAQWLRAAPPAGATATDRTAPIAWTDSEGWELWKVGEDGIVEVSGSAALPVKSEIAARTGTSSDVQTLLENNLREFPHVATHAIVERGAAVQTVSCDGLPLVGPVPGHPRLLVLGGFGRNAPGCALVAAESIAQLVRSGRAEHAATFSPRRFL
jgi:glycine/D-amino acid oxidase-like deaminating enzyme